MKPLVMVVCILSAAFMALPGISNETLPLPRQYAEPLPMASEISTAAEPVIAVFGPHSHANLSIFLLRGKDQVDTRKIITLAEALEQKKIVVHETSDVNLLSVENVSEDINVFIQTGDIVKGGKQDRIMAFDMLVPVKSGKLPIPSFCCESGRWTKRGVEDEKSFTLSLGNANTSSFKLAVQGARGARGGQGEVWDKVREAQMKLADKVGKPVTGASSATSLQLTLEHKDLLAKLDAYEKALAKVLDGKGDVIGFAIAVNGKISGAEVFGSAALFRKVWPRMLNAAAIDALANLENDKKFEPATAKDVEKFLAQVADANGTEMRLAADQRSRANYGRAHQPNDAQIENSPAQRSINEPDANQSSADAMNPTSLSLRLKHFYRDTGKTLIVESQEKGTILHRSYTAR